MAEHNQGSVYDRMTPEQLARAEARIAAKKRRQAAAQAERLRRESILVAQEAGLCAVYGCENEATEEADGDWGCEPNRVSFLDGDVHNAFEWAMVCESCANEYENMIDEMERHAEEMKERRQMDPNPILHNSNFYDINT